MKFKPACQHLDKRLHANTIALPFRRGACTCECTAGLLV